MVISMLWLRKRRALELGPCEFRSSVHCLLALKFFIGISETQFLTSKMSKSPGLLRIERKGSLRVPYTELSKWHPLLSSAQMHVLLF